MRRSRAEVSCLVIILAVVVSCTPATDDDGLAATSDPLPSWNDGEAKRHILEFVARVTDSASPDFVPEAERIATFDNDGTLWSEKPVYFQMLFAMDRVRELAPDGRTPALHGASKP